jgi:hypothetical protein
LSAAICGSRPDSRCVAPCQTSVIASMPCVSVAYHCCCTLASRSARGRWIAWSARSRSASIAATAASALRTDPSSTRYGSRAMAGHPAAIALRISARRARMASVAAAAAAASR